LYRFCIKYQCRRKEETGLFELLIN
jgi:hypothetical protein